MVAVESRGCRMDHCSFQDYLKWVSIGNVRHRLEEILTRGV